MRRVPLRRLVGGPAPGPDRICFYNVWYRGHHNPRYAELLPRLARLDAHLVPISGRRVLSTLGLRAARTAGRKLDPWLLGRAGRRYRSLFTYEAAQIAPFGGPAVADIDDPVYEADAAGLKSGNLAAYVVTDRRAGLRFEQLGVDRPWFVIPQGVGLSSVPQSAIEAVRASRRNEAVVVGHIAAWLLLEGDRGGTNPLYNVAHLLEVWDEIHRRVPAARLWLIGGTSRRVRARIAGRDDIVCFGRLPRSEALARVANFDIALYPRSADQGVRAAKVGEFLGFGVPTVSYDYEVTSDLRETGGGILVDTPREFVEAVEHLARDEGERRRIGRAAWEAGQERDWDRLAARYAEILDTYLRP